ETADHLSHLDVVVVLVRDVHVSARGGRHGEGVVELAVARDVAPPCGEEGAARVELLDAVVAYPGEDVSGISDVDVPAAVGRHPEGFGELAVARAGAPPRGEEGAGGVEFLDAVVATFGDVDVPAPVGRHAAGEGGVAVAR